MKKNLQVYLYSAVGVAAMFLLLAAFNIVTGAVKIRSDLTAEKVHTLSAGTREILAKLDSPVRVRFYYSQTRDATPDTIYLDAYAKQVGDLLNELRRAARGKLILEKYDPQPDSDAEDSAKLDGIEGQPLPPYGEPYYLGVAFSTIDQKEPIPFLSPSRERLLEYDLMRALSRVLQPERPVIGVMSALPVFGMPANPMMMQMGRQGQDPWIFISELQRDFTVREVAASVDQVPEDITVLLVLHPRAFSDAAQYAIDQFVLRGGKLIAFVDPLSIADNQSAMMNPLQRATASGSNLERLFKAWGITYDVSKVAADMNYKTTIGGSAGPQEAPAVLSLTREALNADDILTSQTDNLLLAYPGVFTGTPAPGLTQTVLFKTSENSQLVDQFMAQFGGADKDFRPSGTPYALAIRLTGKFKTAFPDGKPAAGASDTDDAADKPADESPAGPSLKESAAENSVILVADSDMLFDPVVARVQTIPGLGMRIVNPLNGNLNFGQSVVELMTGDNALIAVRSRASLNRPFTKVKRMEEQAQEAYRGSIRRLEESLQETQSKLNELQRTRKEAGQGLVLSKEQQEEILRFRQNEAQIKRELKEVRRKLRQDIDSLQNRLKAFNIAAMPLAVALSGIVAAFIKRKKTAAR